MTPASRIAVTGASGRIGSAVARRLFDDGHELVLLDRRRADVELAASATFVETDLRDQARVASAVAGCEAIVHIGEIPNVNSGFSDCDVFDINTAACRSMLDAALAVGARRFMYTSSCQQYGYWGDAEFDHDRTPSRWPIDEFLPALPRNAYAHSKAANELQCRETCGRTGLELFIYRFPWVMPQMPAERAERFWNKADEKFRDGFWTYLDLRDAVEAYALGIRPDRPIKPLPSRCEAFHFVADDVFGRLPTRDKLARFLPRSAALPEDWPERRSPVDCEKAATYLGWTPRHRLCDAFLDREAISAEQSGGR